MNQMNFEEIKLCLFPSPKSYSNVLTPLKEIVRLTRYDETLSYRTCDYRKRYEAMGKESAKVIKETMVNAFSVADNFQGVGHTALQASYFTGLAMCDIDGINSIQRSGYELFLVVEIPYDQQQNYLSLEKDESQNLEEETPQTLDNQQLDLPF